MLRWFKNRTRFENAKLLKQNQLAAVYLFEFYSDAASLGNVEAEALARDAQHLALDCESKLSLLTRGRTLPSEVQDDQFKINRALRTAYDQVLLGKRAFANQFGQASEPLRPFDVKFEPNEGWKVFFGHLPD